MASQHFHNAHKDDQITQDAGNAANVIGFAGPAGSVASAVLGTPFLATKIYSEYIAGTYPQASGLRLTVTSTFPEWNETKCTPPATAVVTARSSSTGYNADGAIVDAVLQATAVFENAAAIKDFARAGGADNAVSGFERSYSANLDNRANLNQTESGLSSEFAKKARAATDSGLVNIAPEQFGPIELEFGTCVNAMALAPFDGVSVSLDQISPRRAGMSAVSFRTTGFPVIRSVTESYNVRRSIVDLDLTTGEIAPGEEVVITATTYDIEGDQGVTWTVGSGTFEVVKDGATDGISRIVYTAPATGAPPSVAITATSRVAYCVETPTGNPSDTELLRITTGHYIVTSRDPDCLPAGEAFAIFLLDRATDDPAAGTFTLDSGSGTLSPNAASTGANYVASDNAEFVRITVVPDDDPDAVFTIDFATACDETGVFVVTLPFEETDFGNDVTYGPAGDSPAFGELDFGETEGGRAVFEYNTLSGEGTITTTGDRRITSFLFTLGASQGFNSMTGEQNNGVTVTLGFDENDDFFPALDLIGTPTGPYISPDWQVRFLPPPAESNQPGLLILSIPVIKPQ